MEVMKGFSMRSYFFLVLLTYCITRGSDVILHAALICPGNYSFDKQTFQESLGDFSARNFKKDVIITRNDQPCFVFIGYDALEQAMNMMENALTYLATKTKPAAFPANFECKIVCDKKRVTSTQEIVIPIILYGESCKIVVIPKNGLRPTLSEIYGALQQIYEFLGPAFE